MSVCHQTKALNVSTCRDWSQWKVKMKLHKHYKENNSCVNQLPFFIHQVSYNQFYTGPCIQHNDTKHKNKAPWSSPCNGHCKAFCSQTVERRSEPHTSELF